ncbi:MAG TPA: phenylalanine--tRNA ligase subunit alpha [Candidatus Paceibacterota bacterium]
MNNKPGHLHPLTLLVNNVVSTYIDLGFEVTEGPILETDWYNFEALNMLEGHPARDMQDTFYTKKIGSDGKPMMPRTQLSQMQVRYPELHKPPFKIVYFGKAFRNENMDATHEVEHSQIEVMAIGKNINLGDMKGAIEAVLGGVFGGSVKTRLRPGYFPFVEPGIEVDMECFKCKGSDTNCLVCKGTGWKEILGSGMMNPIVLKNGGVDPVEWQGFAYSIGWDRIAMFKYGIPDLRLFNSGDLRLTNQF